MSTDVLITFDTTGSMRPCIAEVRRRVDQALDMLFNNIEDLRVGIIAHGDWCDDNRAIDRVDFTNNKDVLKHFVNHTPNTNGGDTDEFYEYVLNIANHQYRWLADNKILIMIGDANPHKVGYHYADRVYMYDWKKEAQELADKGITLYSVQALGYRGSTEFYKALASYSNGRKVDLAQFTDAVETIIALCYHKVGKLEEYSDELTSKGMMNRNLVNLFKILGTEVSETKYTAKDASGLVPVPPSRFQILHVDTDCAIRDFVEDTGATFRKGRGFYQFTKPEMVQERKEVVLRNKTTGDMFTGAEAREFIGLPFGERGKIRPGYFDKYEVYIQSTSYNRILKGGTKFLYENS